MIRLAASIFMAVLKVMVDFINFKNLDRRRNLAYLVITNKKSLIRRRDSAY